MNSELIALLAQTSLIRAGLSAYLIDSKVLTIQSSTTAASAARLLARNRIRSAPVVDEDGKYAGIIDMATLVSCCLNIFKDISRPAIDQDYLNKRFEFTNTNVGDILGPQEAHVIFENFSLLHVLEVMCISRKHSLAVIDSSRVVTGLVSQSMIIKWILASSAFLPASLLTKTVLEMRPFATMSSISVSLRAIDAFRLLIKQNLSAIAAVDQAGQLVEVFSLDDMVGITDSMTISCLWNNIAFFKDQIRRQVPSFSPVAPLTVAQSITFEQVLRLMVDQRVHRVYVTSTKEQRRLLDCISQTDVLQFLLDVCKRKTENWWPSRLDATKVPFDLEKLHVTIPLWFLCLVLNSGEMDSRPQQTALLKRRLELSFAKTPYSLEN